MIYFLAIPLLAAIVFQDFKWRLIYSILPVLIFSAFLVTGLLDDFRLTLLHTLINSTFLAFQFFMLWLYFVRVKGKESLVDTMIGKGDLAFLLAVTPAFSFGYYVLFYVSGLILALVLNLFYPFQRKTQGTIPLAGILSSYLILVILVARYILDLDFHNDQALLNLINTP